MGERRSTVTPSPPPDAASSFEAIKKTFVDKEGSALRAWLKHFDKNGDEKVSYEEWCHGIRELNYPGDPLALWNEMDTDGSGEITLDEIDAECSDTWRSFRRWASSHFFSMKDMIHQLSGGGTKCEKEQFVEGCKREGWKGNMEDLLFSSLDSAGVGYIVAEDVKFIDKERRKMKRKDLAKQRASIVQNHKAKAKSNAARALAEFKWFLRKKHGLTKIESNSPQFIKFWLSSIDLDQSMSVNQTELFKACTRMGFTGDVRALWRALDQDDSGVAGLENLDGFAAQVLAGFRAFCYAGYGSVTMAFQAFDRRGVRRVRAPEFVAVTRELGFDQGRFVFEGVNYLGKKFLTENDWKFLDEWRPPGWLTADSDPKAAEEFMGVLLRKYKNYLKAWRRVLDRDSSNRVNWQEFETAAQKIHFTGNVAGAWRHLDEDLSGYISLKEIDAESHISLLQFKNWADSEFGGVRNAFKVLDADNSGELTFREFRRTVRDFGFEGSPMALFEALGAEGTGKMTMTIEDISFLDDWETENFDGSEPAGSFELDTTDEAKKQSGISFYTTGPGPGAYELRSGIGAPNTLPQTRHAGAYSLRQRLRDHRINRSDPADRDFSPEPGPATYAPTFNESRRAPTTTFAKSPRAMSVRARASTPGPGSYNPDPSSVKAGRIARSITPRREVGMHPLMRFR